MKAFPLFDDRYRDFLDQPLLVEGEVPRDLSGHLLRVGVGQFSQFGVRHNHWFDGDGAVVRLSLKAGLATHSLKLLNCTPPEEMKAQKMVLGRFGRAPLGIVRRLQSIHSPKMFVNSANTSITQIGGKICALFEACLPTEIDFRSLDRIGELNFNSAIKRSFSAHPKRHAQLPVHFNFGVRFFPKPVIDFYRISEDGKGACLASIPFSGSAFLHDFAITNQYAVFIVTPIQVGIFGYLFKGQSISGAVQRRDNQATEIIVVELSDPRRFRKFEGPPGFLTHSINAFETKNGKIAVDFVTSPKTSDLQRLDQVLNGKIFEGFGRPLRWIIDLQKNEVKTEPLLEWICDFPTLIEKSSNGETMQFAAIGYRDHFSRSNELFDCVGIYDVGDRGLRKMVFDGDTVCEANYVVGTRGKYLIVQCFSHAKNSSYFAIIRLGRNPELVVKLWSPSALPYTLHGDWLPE